MCTAPTSSDNVADDGVVGGDGDEDSVSVAARISQLRVVAMATNALGLDHVESVMDARERRPMIERRRALISFAQDNGLPAGGIATAPKTVVQSLELLAAIKVNEAYAVLNALGSDDPQPVSAQDDPNPTRSVDFGI